MFPPERSRPTSFASRWAGDSLFSCNHIISNVVSRYCARALHIYYLFARPLLSSRHFLESPQPPPRHGFMFGSHARQKRDSSGDWVAFLPLEPPSSVAQERGGVGAVWPLIIGESPVKQDAARSMTCFSQVPLRKSPHDQSAPNSRLIGRFMLSCTNSD